jgi:hypothetical protein
MAVQSCSILVFPAKEHSKLTRFIVHQYLELLKWRCMHVPEPGRASEVLHMKAAVCVTIKMQIDYYVWLSFR